MWADQDGRFRLVKVSRTPGVGTCLLDSLSHTLNTCLCNHWSASLTPLHEGIVWVLIDLLATPVLNNDIALGVVRGHRNCLQQPGGFWLSELRGCHLPFDVWLPGSHRLFLGWEKSWSNKPQSSWHILLWIKMLGLVYSHIQGPNINNSQVFEWLLGIHLNFMIAEGFRNMRVTHWLWCVFVCVIVPPSNSWPQPL